MGSSTSKDSDANGQEPEKKANGPTDKDLANIHAAAETHEEPTQPDAPMEEIGGSLERTQKVDTTTVAEARKALLARESKAREEAAAAEAEARASGASKTLVQLLHQDVSLTSIKELLTYEIPTPFSGTKSADLADIALSEGWVTEGELATLRENQQMVGDSLGVAMVQKGFITQEQLETAMKQKERTGQPLWRTLMQLRMLVPEQVVSILHQDIALPFGARPNSKFFDLLIARKVATEEELDAAWRNAREAGVEFRQFLVEQNIASESELAETLAQSLELPYSSLSDVVEIQPRLLRMVPASLLHRHQALPLRVVDDQLWVAFAEEHNVRDMRTLGLLLEYELYPVIAPRDTLKALIEKHLPPENSELAVGTDEDLQRLEDAGHVMPAVELLTVVLRGSVRSKATDIHIEPHRESTRIRYRIDGLLHDVMSVNPIVGRKMGTRIQAMANMYTGNSNLPLDGHLTMDVDEDELQFRVSAIPGMHGLKLAMRKVQTDLSFCNFETLGMNLEHRRLLSDILDANNGLVLTTGPVGSGKTTTLYACLSVMDCFVHNVMTIEDPVEYDVAGVVQIQTNAKAGLTFQVGLRALLRQDPDILMVGEIRDEETADIAVRAAMTGQLVLSTLHANSAPAAVNSLLHLGVRPFLLASALRGIVFQRLVRKLCPACKEPYEATSVEKKELGVPAEESLTLYHGKGCQECFNTGFSGRSGVFEVLKVEGKFREVMSQASAPEVLEEAARSSGMLRLHQHASQLVTSGVTSIDELARIT